MLYDKFLSLLFILLSKFLKFVFSNVVKIFTGNKPSRNNQQSKPDEPIFINGPLYTKAQPLFSNAETQFFHVLNEAFGEKYLILGKIRVADIIVPEGKRSDDGWQTAFNRVSQKHVDYVLCDQEDLDVKAVIELNDKSHNRSKTKKRDLFLEESFHEANIPFIQVPAARYYDSKQIRDFIISNATFV
ncbi:MAG: DUF2726 domain-containing protein [Magnetococcales bacterium]|nr:DUF2726 domain-containing protein [Magnetococcales bacterium]